MKRVARDIMNPKVIIIANTMDLREVAKIFVEEGITGAPVVDDMGHPRRHGPPHWSHFPDRLGRA